MASGVVRPHPPAVLRRQANGTANVTDVMAAWCVAQILMSHHLRALREADLVTCRREGECITDQLAGGVLGRGATVLKLGCGEINFRNGISAGRPRTQLIRNAELCHRHRRDSAAVRHCINR